MRITHSLYRHSDLGNPQFAKVAGKCELSECAFVPFILVLQLAVRRIDNLFKGRPSLTAPHHRFQVNFLCPHWTGAWNSHSTNPVSSSYSLTLAVQSHPITFRWLSAFLSCYFPVTAFASSVRQVSSRVIYGVVPSIHRSSLSTSTFALLGAHLHNAASGCHLHRFQYELQGCCSDMFL